MDREIQQALGVQYAFLSNFDNLRQICELYHGYQQEVLVSAVIHQNSTDQVVGIKPTSDPDVEECQKLYNKISVRNTSLTSQLQMVTSRASSTGDSPRVPLVNNPIPSTFRYKVYNHLVLKPDETIRDMVIRFDQYLSPSNINSSDSDPSTTTTTIKATADAVLTRCICNSFLDLHIGDWLVAFVPKSPDWYTVKDKKIILTTNHGQEKVVNFNPENEAPNTHFSLPIQILAFKKHTNDTATLLVYSLPSLSVDQ